MPTLYDNATGKPVYPQELIVYYGSLLDDKTKTVPMPNGMHMPLWKPKAAGLDGSFELSPILQGLAGVKEHVTVVGGLNAGLPAQ